MNRTKRTLSVRYCRNARSPKSRPNNGCKSPPSSDFDLDKEAAIPSRKGTFSMADYQGNWMNTMRNAVDGEVPKSNDVESPWRAGIDVLWLLRFLGMPNNVECLNLEKIYHFGLMRVWYFSYSNIIHEVEKKQVVYPNRNEPPINHHDLNSLNDCPGLHHTHKSIQLHSDPPIWCLFSLARITSIK